MFIKFSELSFPFGRLAPGAVLVSPSGERYMKMVDEEYSYVWLQPFDPLFSSRLPDAQMSQTVREDWLVLV